MSISIIRSIKRNRAIQITLGSLSHQANSKTLSLKYRKQGVNISSFLRNLIQLLKNRGIAIARMEHERFLNWFFNITFQLETISKHGKLTLNRLLSMKMKTISWTSLILTLDARLISLLISSLKSLFHNYIIPATASLRMTYWLNILTVTFLYPMKSLKMHSWVLLACWRKSSWSYLKISDLTSFMSLTSSTRTNFRAHFSSVDSHTLSHNGSRSFQKQSSRITSTFLSRVSLNKQTTFLSMSTLDASTNLLKKSIIGWRKLRTEGQNRLLTDLYLIIAQLQPVRKRIRSLWANSWTMKWTILDSSALSHRKWYLS